MRDTSRLWFRWDREDREIDLNLFCFPYAGGTTAVYRDWAGLLPANVRTVPVELPGRGARLKEPPYDSLPALIDALTEAILPALDAPFAFFGHEHGRGDRVRACPEPAPPK